MRRIKQADLEVRAQEKLVLLPNSPEEWEDLVEIEPSPLAIHYVSPEKARDTFLHYFETLTLRQTHTA